MRTCYAIVNYDAIKDNVFFTTKELNIITKNFKKVLEIAMHDAKAYLKQKR